LARWQLSSAKRDRRSDGSGFTGSEHRRLNYLVRRAGLAEVLFSRRDRFEIFGDAIEELVDRVGMIERGAKQGATVQASRELPGQLLHAADGGQVWHVFAQHVEVFEQQGALVVERGLERFAAVHRVFDLTKDPRIGHRAAAD